MNYKKTRLSIVFTISALVSVQATALSLDQIFNKQITTGVSFVRNQADLRTWIGAPGNILEDANTAAFQTGQILTKINDGLSCDIGTDLDALTDVPTILTEVNKIQTLINDTTGIATVLDRYQQAEAALNALPEGSFEDLRKLLESAQQILTFSQQKLTGAINRMNANEHAELIPFLSSTQSLAQAVMGTTSAPVDLQLLVQMVSILPEEILAIAGETLLMVGIDNNFVTNLNQTIGHVELLQQVPLGSLTDCNFVNANAEDIRLAANGALGTGLVLKGAGKLLVAFGHTAVSGIFEGVEVGVHGYAHYKIKNSKPKTLGNILDGIGSAMFPLAATGRSAVARCEILALLEDETRYTDDIELAEHQQIILNNISAARTNIELTINAQSNTQLQQIAAVSNQLSSAENNIITKIDAHDASVRNEINNSTNTINASINSTSNVQITLLEEHNENVTEQLESFESRAEHLLLRSQIERALAEDLRISFFYLPNERGGNLELVAELVATAMNENNEYNVSVADKDFVKAEFYMAQAEYKNAWKYFSKTYRTVTKSGNDQKND